MNEYDICYPDYENSIVNVSSTIMEYFGGEHCHEANSLLLSKLNDKKYNKIVLLILDGLGTFNMDCCLGEDSFLQTHKIADISSVFPPTTASALTSIYAEQYPNEHCIIGGSIWLEDEQILVKCFSSESWTKFPYIYFGDKLKRIGIKTNSVSIYGKKGRDRVDNIDSLVNRIGKLSKKKGKRFVISYFNQPDYIIHDEGVHGAKTKEMIEQIEKSIENLQQNMSDDTAVIIIADHGLIDCHSFCNLSDCNGLMDCLSVPPSCEPTAMAFFVKEGRHEEFQRLFKENVEGYILYTRAEVLESKLFGIGEDNRKLANIVGDYFAVSIGDGWAWPEHFHPFKAVHAGLHKGEMIVPLILFDKSV